MSETLDRLLDAAESDIRLRGYHAVSFRELADALGIKSSSVHYYFRQKEDLGVALVKRYGERFFAALEAKTATARTAEARLKAFVGVYRQALTESDRICLCGMLGAESCGLPAVLADAVAGFFQANLDWVAGALPEGLSPAVRRKEAAHIIATLQGAMMLSNSLGDHKVFDAAAQALLASLAK